MFPLSVMRFKLELMPCFAGCTKQKLPTTSTIQNSLSPVAASMIFSVVGSSIRVVYFTLARMGTMSCEGYCTVRAESWAKAPMEEKNKAQLTTNFRCRIEFSLAFAVRSCYGQRARLEWPLFREMAKAIRKTVAVEILPLLEVVASIVGRHPVRGRIDVQVHLLGGLRLANQHLARWNKAVDKVQFGVVRMKRFAVNFSVHVRVGEEDLCRAALRHYRQHPRFLKLFDGLRRQDHRRFVLAPGLLRLHYVIANSLVFDEEPRFVEQEELGCAELLRVGNFIRCPVQNIKQQWFQDFRCIVPAVEIERLKAFERKRILGVVEEEAVLSTTGPAMQAFLQLANDVPKVRNRALVRL